MTRIKLDGNRKRIKLTQVGKRGPQGIQGIAATIEVGQTTTVGPGSPAGVVNVGNANDAILDFEIPQGIQGPVGEGVEPGGTTGQVLRKKADGDYDTEWHTPTKSDVGLGNVPNLDTTQAVNQSHTHSNKSVLDATSASYTAAEKDKLATIEHDAQINTVDSVNGHTGEVVLDADDLEDVLTNKKFVSQAEKDKLAGIAAGAEVNVQSDWNASSGDAHILNKPTLGTAAATAATDYATAAQGARADTAVQPATLTAHTSNTSNPHGVTKAQVGLGNVPNTDFTADVSANTAARHTHSNEATLDATTASFTTADETKLDGIETGAQVNTVTSVAGKTGVVTLAKGDVGLGNVDNTSDANKPISTATQTALNAKANASDTVNLTGNQTVAGVKTFSSSPVVPTATTNTQAVNKGQMDAADALKVSKAGDTMTGLLNSQSIFPSASIVYNLGSTNFRYSGVWAQRVNLSASAYIDGATGGRADIVASNGFTINGAGYITGSGFPSGVVSAPVGSIYIDTAVTNGASSWIKKSGTGNTGWQVLEGDTGWRDITTLFSAYLEKVNVNDYGVYIRRIDGMVTISLKAQSKLASFSGETVVLPTGFQGAGGIPVLVTEYIGVANPGRLQTQISSSFGFVSSTNIGVGTRIYGSTSFPVAVAHSWPTTLPGTAV